MASFFNGLFIIFLLVGLRDSLLVFHPHGFLGKSFAGEVGSTLLRLFFNALDKLSTEHQQRRVNPRLLAIYSSKNVHVLAVLLHSRELLNEAAVLHYLINVHCSSLDVPTLKSINYQLA